MPGGQTHEIAYRLHNPGWYQRYIQPFYRLWWPGVLTCPLSVLIPLVVLVLVMVRKKDADVARLMSEQKVAPEMPKESPSRGAPRPSAMPGSSTRGGGARARGSTRPSPEAGASYDLPPRHQRTASTEGRSRSRSSGPTQTAGRRPTSRRRGSTPDSRPGSGVPSRRRSSGTGRRRRND